MTLLGQLTRPSPKTLRVLACTMTHPYPWFQLFSLILRSSWIVQKSHDCCWILDLKYQLQMLPFCRA